MVTRKSAKATTSAAPSRQASAMENLRAAHEEALAASGIDLSTRAIVRTVTALVAGAGVYYVAVQIGTALVAGALAFTGSMFISFVLAILSIIVAMCSGWYAYQLTRIAFDKLVAVDYAAQFEAAKSNVVGIFSRRAA